MFPLLPLQKLVSLACFLSYLSAVHTLTTVLQYEISGEDFYNNFIAQNQSLLVKYAASKWRILDLINKEKVENVLNLEGDAALIFSRASDTSKLQTDEFLDKSFQNGGFVYDITDGSVELQKAVTVPAMLLSCRELYETFNKNGKVTLVATKSDVLNARPISSTQHAILAVLKGEIEIRDIHGDTAEVETGDLLYVNPYSLEADLQTRGHLLYLNFTWSQTISGECKGSRPPMLALTKDIAENEDYRRYVDHTLPDLTLNTGYKIPLLGLGTARLFEKTYYAVKVALDIGYKLIDTAQIYSAEEYKPNVEDFQVSSEGEIGRAIYDSKTNRSKLFLVTKIDPNFMSMKLTAENVHQSLKRLQTNYLDLVLVHDFDTSSGCQATDKGCKSSPWISWRALEDLQSRGMLRSIGVSNIALEDLAFLVKEFANSKVSVVQNWFDPLHQDREVRKFCAKNGIKYMGYSALGTVWSGEEGLGYDINPIINNDVIIDAATADALPATSYVLRWAMERDVIVIPCSTNPSHLESNFFSMVQNIDPALAKNVDKLDNLLGNPDSEGWERRPLPKSVLRPASTKAVRDEL